MDAKLLDILVCPVTKGALIYDKAKQELISVQAGARLSDQGRHSGDAGGGGAPALARGDRGVAEEAVRR